MARNSITFTDALRAIGRFILMLIIVVIIVWGWLIYSFKTDGINGGDMIKDDFDPLKHGKIILGSPYDHDEDCKCSQYVAEKDFRLSPGRAPLVWINDSMAAKMRRQNFFPEVPMDIDYFDMAPFYIFWKSVNMVTNFDPGMPTLNREEKKNPPPTSSDLNDPVSN